MTVHILFHGRAYCGMDCIPADWPPGNRWVRCAEHHQATCKTCLLNLLTNATHCEQCDAVLVDGYDNPVGAGFRLGPDGTVCNPACKENA